MKKYLFYLIIILFIISCASSNSKVKKNITKSGKRIEKAYKSDKFVNIDVNDSIKVNVKKDNSYNVNVKMDKAYINYLDVSVKGNTLHLSMKKNIKLKNPEVIINVSMPEIERAELDGSSVLQLNNMDPDKLYLEIKGSSRVSGNINAEELTIEESENKRGQIFTFIQSIKFCWNLVIGQP